MPYLGTLPVSVTEIPAGPAGTRATLAEMARLARWGATQPKLCEWARAIVREAGVAQRDYPGELRAYFDFVQRHVRYVLDPRGLEWVQDPLVTLTVAGQGDCDDMATLLAALAGCTGHGGSFRAIAANPSQPDEFSHVYALLGTRTPQGVTWYAADPTQPGASFGWEPPHAFRVMDQVVWLP